jgi:hypothetical protein
MLSTLVNPKVRIRFVLNSRLLVVPLLFFAVASVAVAQDCPAVDAAIYPGFPGGPPTLLHYPMTSDRYAVQYKLGGGVWTNAQVYINVYGGTNTSPFESYTNYPSYPNTSMSFVSIPARANADVQLRVTLLSGPATPPFIPKPIPFLASDHMSVRPGEKGIPAQLMSDGTVQIFTDTASNFAGEQFVLWWERDTTLGGGFQGLAFFLDPPYDRPAGGNVFTISGPGPSVLAADFVPPPGIDTLDFEGMVIVEGPNIEGTDIEGPGAQSYIVPKNINTIFLGPGAWVQGKLRFDQGSAHDAGGQVKRIYGPGVLDGSRFNYKYRQCRDSVKYPNNRVDGVPAISYFGSPAAPDTFSIDGIIVSDIDYTATDSLANGIVNNMKVIGWNGNNDGLDMGDGTRASNVFVRTGDDSLEMWGGSITVTNATVWQNTLGGVVNLGWSYKFPGDYNLVDGLYVVKTDWSTPTTTSWCTDPLCPVPTDLLNHQNNGVIVSLMVPGTNYGTVHPPVYRNIYLDDPPWVLFSLKILPPDCDLKGLVGGVCPAVNLTLPSVVNLKIENVFTPQSIQQNSIGFQTLPKGFTYDFPAGTPNELGADYTLTGDMNISLTNVFMELPNGIWLPLLNFDSQYLGKITTNGNNVNVNYDFAPGLLPESLFPGLP